MSIVLLLEVSYYNCNDDKIPCIIHALNLNLYCPIESPVPIPLKSEIISKPCATEFRWKLLAIANCDSNFRFCSPALFHAFPGMRMNYNGHQKERRRRLIDHLRAVRTHRSGGELA